MDSSLSNQKMRRRKHDEAYITAAQYKKMASTALLVSESEINTMKDMSIIRTQAEIEAAKAKREAEDKASLRQPYRIEADQIRQTYV